MYRARGFTRLEVNRILKAQELRAGLLTGFTLIELLVVIAIIALLMAILMPALQRVKKQAKAVICQAHLKEWATIFALYTDDNNGNFPIRTGNSGRWMDSMRDYYITIEDIRCCPMAIKLANPMAQVGADIFGGTFMAWGKLYSIYGRTPEYYGSYGINGYLYVPGSDPLYGKPADYYWRTPNVKGAADILMFMDCYFWCGWPEDNDDPPQYDGAQIRSDANAMNRFCIDRHDGFINASFMDYSIRKMGLKELWTLKWHRTYNINGPWTKAGNARPGDWPLWMRNFKDY